MKRPSLKIGDQCPRLHPPIRRFDKDGYEIPDRVWKMDMATHEIDRIALNPHFKPTSEGGLACYEEGVILCGEIYGT